MGQLSLTQVGDGVTVGSRVGQFTCTYVIGRNVGGIVGVVGIRVGILDGLGVGMGVGGAVGVVGARVGSVEGSCVGAVEGSAVGMVGAVLGGGDGSCDGRVVGVVGAVVGTAEGSCAGRAEGRVAIRLIGAVEGIEEGSQGKEVKEATTPAGFIEAAVGVAMVPVAVRKLEVPEPKQVTRL